MRGTPTRERDREGGRGGAQEISLPGAWDPEVGCYGVAPGSGLGRRRLEARVSLDTQGVDNAVWTQRSRKRNRTRRAREARAHGEGAAR